MRRSRQQGISLIEAMLAVAFFAIIAVSTTRAALSGLTAQARAGLEHEAALLASGALEGVYAVQDRAWNELEFSTTSLQQSGGEWILAGEGVTETVGDFTRSVAFNDICRDVSDNLVSCPGAYLDERSKEVVVTVAWTDALGNSRSVERSGLVTNWSSGYWTQTDWSGSSGVSEWNGSQSTQDLTVFRSTEYYISDGTFTGTSYDLTLDQPLKQNYFALVQGSDGDGTTGSNRGPDEDYARLTEDPYGTGDLAESGSNDVIALERDNAVNSWVGVVTVVECLQSCDTAGFELLDVQDVQHANGSAEGTDTSDVSWGSIDQAMLFGGFNGAGCFTVDVSNGDHDLCHVRFWPSGSNTINWERNKTNNEALSTVMVLEWGSEWNVQRATVSGTNGGNGANAAGEYDTATIDSVVRDDTWIWGSGYTVNAGIGDAAEASLITLGNGVAQNASETSVAVGQEYGVQKYFEVYALTHTDLAVDYRFKTDGDSANLTVSQTVDSAASSTNRMAIVYNGQNGTGTAFPRPMFSARYTTATNVQLERRRSGQNFPSWVQGIDFQNIEASIDVALLSNDYDTASNIDATIPGELVLGVGAGGTDSWLPGGGDSLEEDDDTEFGAGATSSTEIIGSGTSAYIELTAQGNWEEYDDSGGLVSGQDMYGISSYNASTTDIWASGGSGKINHYNGVVWSESQDIGVTDLNDIVMTAEDDGWIVGDGGALYQYNGTSWSIFSGASATQTTDTDFNAGTTSSTEVSGTGSAASTTLEFTNAWAEHSDSPVVTQELWDISVVSASDIWASGLSGKILHYDGSSWTESQDTGNQNHEGIAMVSASDGWIASNSAKIYRYNGSTWSQFVDLGNGNYRGIHMNSASDGWIVGNGGRLVHYNGTTWSQHTDTGSDNWDDVDCTSASACWVVSRGGEIYTYNGTTWSQELSSGNTFRGVSMVSASDGWAVGNSGAIYRYNGSTWSSFTSPTSENIYDVDVVASNDVWAAANNGEILHFNGTAWSIVNDFGNSEDFRGMEMISSSAGWIVGNSGIVYEYTSAYAGSGTFTSSVIDSGLINAQWDELTWTEELTTGSDVTITVRTGESATPDVSWTAWSSEFTDPTGDDIGANTDRYLQYRITFTRGSNAQHTPGVGSVTVTFGATPTTQNLEAISAVSASDIWATGRNGAIINYNGTGWTATSSPTGEHLNGVYIRTATDGWAVGENGVILRYDGFDWTLFVDTGTEDWNSVYMLSATDGFVVGDSGAMRRWNGTTWSTVTTGVAGNLHSVWALDSSNVWVGAASNKFYLYNGSTFVEDYDNGADNWYDILFFDSLNGWAVAQGGTIARFGAFYETSGTFTSQVLDSGAAGSDWAIVSWTETLISDQDVEIELRTGETSVPDGGWDAWAGPFTEAAGDPTTGVADGRYIQYRVNFTRGTIATSSPQFDDIRIIYDLPTGQNVNAVEMISDILGWAVGNNGEIVEYDGSVWIATTSPVGNSLFGIDSLNASDIWAGGAAGKILHFDGVSWTEHTDTGGTRWNDFEAVSASDAWVVGNGGNIYRYNGSTWSTVTSPAGSNLYTVELTASDEGWAGGANGTLISWNGSTWSAATSPTSNDINDIFSISSSSIWAAADNGEILYYNGTSWSVDTDTGIEDWNGITFGDSDQGFVVASQSDIYAYDGSIWSATTTPTSENLNDVMLATATTGWAVGNNGTFVEYQKTLTGYALLGTLTSSAFDTGGSAYWGVIEWDEIIPSCSPVCDVQLQIQTAPDGGGSPGVWSPNWSGPDGEDGDDTDYYTASSSERIHTDHNLDQWIRYRVTLTGDGDSTPTFEEVRIDYTQ